MESHNHGDGISFEEISSQNDSSSTFVDDIQRQLNRSSLFMFFLTIALAGIWVIYITCYNSRVLGLIITAILNKVTKYGHIHFGSFSFSVLSGKIMFRDFHFITEDYSVRVQYGWIIFKWWKPYVPKAINEDLSHLDTRVQAFLEDFEVHVYNRSAYYDRILKLFTTGPDKSETPEEEETEASTDNERVQKKDVTASKFNWRDLVPVIKITLSSGRLVFGNHLVANQLIMSIEDGHFTYTTIPPSTPFDQFMHDVTLRADNFKLMFVPSPKYTGPQDEPPRFMGEGFVILQTSAFQLHFCMDEPGIVTHELERVELADGETVVRRTYPHLGMDVKCGKNTDFNYGPWADRQRENLWKFFYPPDYQPLVPTEEAKPGEYRKFLKFDFTLNLMEKSTVDILFTKNSVTQAIHMNTGQGSYVEASIPWITSEDGYTTKVKGQLLLVDATTSLQYRSLVECETFEFIVTAAYPKIWNDHQDWTCDFIVCKATVCLIFHHKHFFSDLIEDWSTKTVPDIYHFVPYTWTINTQIKNFELVLLANEYNWIDTSSKHPENSHIAFCGEGLDLSLVLPYNDYNPATVNVGFIIKGENAFCRLYLPENNTSRHVILSLARNMKLMDRDGRVMEDPFNSNKKQWRRLTQESEGWIDCWMTSNVTISINYMYHPMPELLDHSSTGEAGEAVKVITTPELEEEILIPLRPMRSYSQTCPPEDFEPNDMEPDHFTIELEVAPSTLCLYGSLLRNFLHVKENYLGEDQVFTDYADPTARKKTTEGNLGPMLAEECEPQRKFDEREYRPFSVTVSVAIHDIHAHLVKNCNIDGLPCPSILLERLCFELDKQYLETKLQLLLSPVVLIAKDTFQREEDKHLSEGHLGLSGLQVRGHAMFSSEGLPLDSETLEYGWLIEAIIGDLTGKLTCPQLQNLVEFIQTFITLVEDPENCLERPIPYQLCQHMLPQPQCRMLSRYPFYCPSSEDIKYRMTRASVDSVNFFLVESGTALNVQVHSVKLSTCNLHGTNTRSGITARIEHISLKQHIASAALKQDPCHPEMWLESGGLVLGPIDGEAAMALPNPDFHSIQGDFLKVHDKKTQRLWFLWPHESLRSPISQAVIGKCGCHGGCVFFGNNRNGIGFFHPRRTKDSFYSAVLQVSPDGEDPGFGQSLLFRDKLVFDVPPNNGALSPSRVKGFTFTRGYMSNVASPESPSTNITVVEDPSVAASQTSSTLTGGHSDGSVEQPTSWPRKKDSSSKSAAVPKLAESARERSLSDKTVTTPSDTVGWYFEEGSLTSPGSETYSLISREDSSRGHARSMSHSSSLTGYNASPSLSERKKHMLSEMCEQEKASSGSLLPSPKFLRHEMGSKAFSAVSLESERYYSAEEDADVSSNRRSDSIVSHDSMDVTGRSLDSTVLHMSEYPNDSVLTDKTVTERRNSEASTLSYESAPSDQSAEDFQEEEEDIEMPENFSMVDLHSQVNKPITKSPILMSCYASHMTQLQCSDWSDASQAQPTRSKPGLKSDPSGYSLSSVSQSVQYVHSSACVPSFTKIRQGFNSSLMKEKEVLSKDFKAPDLDDSKDPFTSTAEDPTAQDTEEHQSLLNNASITTAVVKLKGSMDVLLTPLFLESFQRYAEAVIPTLNTLHPSSIIDGLHSQCLDRLKRQNRLKKGKTNEEEQQEKRMAERQFSTDSRTNKGEMKTSSIQALFTLSKINICVLQSGIVEEVIAFSALDNINELTCVSLLAVCVDKVDCRLLSNSHSCKTLVDSPSVSAPLQSSSPKKKARATKSDAPLGKDQVEQQMSEICREEDVGTLQISRIHLQLQRLLKNSNYSEDILLTAIPDYRSRVLFKFDKDFIHSSGVNFANLPHRSSSLRKESSGFSPRAQFSRHSSRDGKPSLSRQSSKDSESRSGTLPRLFRRGSIDEDGTGRPKFRKQESRDSQRARRDQGIGFIMFECGLEGIKATAVRRIGFKDVQDTEFIQRMENISRKSENVQNETRVELEQQMKKMESKQKESTPKSAPKSDVKDNDSIHSWDSRVSIASSVTSVSPSQVSEPLKGDASSGVLELNTIWLNFAAPPPISIKQKVDFTRMDWNLLSTATTAINAWLNPADRLMQEIKSLILCLTHRTSSVMACIMTEALEVPGIQLPFKSRYNKITTLAKTLQEDPSCQLLTVLRKYLHKVSTEPVERAVKADTLPQLITIQKGILALTRQWKNNLYMPQMSEINFKSRKSVRPYTVKFALPMQDIDELDERESTADQFDIVDERISLLMAEGGSVHHSVSISSLTDSKWDSTDHHEAANLPSGLSQKQKKFGSAISGLRSNFYSATSGTPPAQSAHESPERRIQSGHKTSSTQMGPSVPPLIRNDSNYSFHSAAASLTSLDREASPPPTPLKTEPPKPSSILKNKMDKANDMYNWMAKQRADFKGLSIDDDNRSFKRQDSLLAAFGSGWSQDDSRQDLNDQQFAMATSIMQLADAQSFFKPFLQSIGLHVEGVRPSAMMKKFGGSLSLQGKLDVLKIQIADSDRQKGKGKSKRRRQRMMNLLEDTPVFLCEDFSVSVAMKDVIDFENRESGENTERTNITLNFAMHKLEAKPTTLQVNFMINCKSVTQYVDMRLLRLIHQFVTMAENVEETRKELKQSHSDLNWVKTHRKQDSKDSTSSADTQHSDVSHSGGISPSSGDLPSVSVKSGMDLDSSVGRTYSKSGTLLSKSSGLSVKAQYEQGHSSAPGKKPNVTNKDLKRTKLEAQASVQSAENGTESTGLLTPPQSLNLSDTVTIDIEDSSPAMAEKTIVDEIKESTPKCWRTLYHLLDLYSTLPEMKTVKRKPSSKLPVIEEEPEPDWHREANAGDPRNTPLITRKTEGSKVDAAATEEATIGDAEKSNDARSSFHKTSFKQSIYIGESIPLVVFGIAKVEKVKILAVLSGLKLDAILSNVHASGTYREKVKGFVHRKSSESSVTAHIGNTLINLLEGIPPDMKTVVTVHVEKTQGLHTTILRRGKEHNSAMVSVGAINIDIPQHPMVLHGMMTRSTREISTTLQEFRRPMSRTSRILEPPQESSSVETNQSETRKNQKPKPQKAKNYNRPTFLQIHFKAVFQGLTTGASLLPSLKAQHKTGVISVSGMTGKKARFTLDLPSHQLSFKSKPSLQQLYRQVHTTETSLPSEAEIELPPILMFADYRHHKASSATTEKLTEGLVLKEGGYLSAVAEVGMLEHSLTTDLLNHLVFVQKVFMKEVNELVQKVSGSDKPVPLWTDEGESPQHNKPMLYSLIFRFKGIQITATTPTSSAVRLETGSVDLEVSNRVQMASRERTQDADKNRHAASDGDQKMFIKAQVDLNLALGQLTKNPMFEEAEPEFQTMAFFKTKIGIRNALQDEMIPGVSTDQEALLITLTRPIVLAQPLAFDRAVLVWLNYKNAYEYWTEQRMALNNEVQRATRQVMDRLPSSSSSLSTLFLQVTVDDMGLCVPMSTAFSQVPSTSHLGRFTDSEPGAALVLTIKSTQISACSSGSLVSKGRFQDFCVRFASDFDFSWDDWKPDYEEDPVMNACVVPEGTYEVCSRTINKQASDPNGNAKWILNVQWEMQGISVHLDTNIGKSLSALGQTLTALAGQPDEEFTEDDIDGRPDSIFSPDTDFEVQSSPRRPSQMLDALPAFVYDTSMDPKQRFRQIEQKMNEQAKVVQDLKQLGASLQTIETEARMLEELKAIVFHDFRREMLNKLKKQSESRTSALKDQLGIGNRPTHIRSKSYGGTHRRERTSNIEMERLAAYNQELSHSRNESWDISKTLPAKVQFGDTSAYSPPETPDSMTSSFGRSHYSDSPSLEARSHSWAPQDMSSSMSQTDSSSSQTGSDSDDCGTLKRDPMFDSDASFPSFRRKDDSKQDTLTPSIGSGGSTKATAEPNIDFELDVKVFIDSGKCVLHPKDSKEDEARRQQKREKTPDPLSSPGTKKKLRKQETASSLNTAPGKKQSTTSQPPLIENTVFFLPSIDLKVHYNSKVSNTDSTSTVDLDKGPYIEIVEGEEVMMRRRPPRLSNQSPSSIDSTESTMSSGAKKLGVKKANLYAWLSLQSLPEEMVISPCLLDFLEQALEPLPIGLTNSQNKTADVMDSVLPMDLDGSYNSLSTTVSQTSFPVDVVVFICVEPSIIRFNCLPSSRVECLLKVPSLELVFSTKSSDIECNIGEGTPPLKTKFSKKFSRERHFSGGKKTSDQRSRAGSTTSNSEQATLESAGGLSFTGALSDFSLYIFHPYGGGGQRKMTPSYDLGSIQENEHGTSWYEISRRDMLSLNVEFVKLNIARSRKLDYRATDFASKSEPQTKSNIVRFSAICDIGSAAFKYDMRRLSEILSFPKAWYNRTLARRMFLGDDSYAHAGEEDWDSSSSSSQGDAGPSGPTPKLFTSSPSLNHPSGSDTVKRTHHRRGSSGDKLKIQLSSELKKEIDSKFIRKGSLSAPQTPTDVFSAEPPAHMPSGTFAHVSHRMKPTGNQTELGASKHKRHNSGHTSPKITQWETLVLFAVNLSKLNLHVNMSNVMGNTVWTTQQIKSQGRLAIDSSGHRDLKITGGTGSSKFESKGGVVGGALDLNDLNVCFEVCEDPESGKQPIHSAGFSVHALECRMDYMGTSILMARLSDLCVALRDEWHVEAKAENDTPLATTRPAFLFAHGNLEWDQFHIMISRSTTPDIIKIVSKIDEFIMMQFTSSKRVLSAFGPMTSNRRTSDRRKLSEDSDCIWDIRHHRHWQKALALVVGCRFSMLPSVIPKEGTILGGNMTLKGKNLTLACFHGINFRSKSWALFTVNEPYIQFATESQKIPEGGIHVVQDLSFYIGHDFTQMQHGRNMASICKLSRGHSMPPTFTSVQEWFHYTFATTEVKDLDNFPHIQHEEDGSEMRRIRKLHSYSHDTEMVFILPRLQLQLKTIHKQSEHEPLPDDPKQVVECSFVTEFEDHIFVAMDAEVILFLHDLVSMYIKEKDKGVRTYSQSAKSAKSPDSDKKKVTDPTTALKQDWREFECKTWHLEPTVRLLHWASKQIDPVGVDYILQKLGFTHARVTIPKWMQRGFMDPLDKFLSFLIEKLIAALKEKQQENINQEED